MCFDECTGFVPGNRKVEWRMDEELIPVKEGKIYHTTEGKILWAGLVLSILLIMVIGYYLKTDPVRARALFLALIAHTFGGRAAGIGLCVMEGLSISVTILYNFYLEVLIVCFTYSVFILSMKNYIKFRWVLLYTEKLMEKASQHKEKMRTYGWLGVFIFVMAPLPVTGPVVGSIIGYLIRLDFKRNFSAVLLGTFAAIVVWVFCFDFLEQHLHVIRYVLIVIIAVVVITHLKTIKDWIVSNGWFK